MHCPGAHGQRAEQFTHAFSVLGRGCVRAGSHGRREKEGASHIIVTNLHGEVSDVRQRRPHLPGVLRMGSSLCMRQGGAVPSLDTEAEGQGQWQPWKQPRSRH